MSTLNPSSSAVSTAFDNYNKAINNYQKSLAQNTGEIGFNRGFDMSQKAASRVADAARGAQTAEAVKAARMSGLSRSKAAELASRQAGQSYANNWLGAQSNNQNAANQQLANLAQGMGNVASQKGNIVGATQQEAQGQYNRTWGNVKGGASALGHFVGAIASMISDENLKTGIQNISHGNENETLCEKYSDDEHGKLKYIDDILKRCEARYELG